MSCLTDTETLGGKVNYIMTRLYPGHELPQFRELASEKWPQRNGNKLTLELKLTVLKTTKMVLVRSPMTNFKMTLRTD